MPEGFKIADAFVDIHARGHDRVGREVRDEIQGDRSFEQAGEDAGEDFGTTFTRTAEGRLRDARGRFTAAAGESGEDSGEEFGSRFTRSAEGRLRDAQGRFTSASKRSGDESGDEFGKSFGEGIGRHWTRLLGQAGDFGTRLGRSMVGGLGGALGSLGDVLAGGLKFAGIATGIATIGASAAASAGFVTSLVAAIMPVLGITAALPGLALAGAAAFGVWKLATGGLSEAMAAAKSGNTEALAAAMGKLSDSGRAFIREFDVLLPRWNEFKSSAQDAFLAPILGQLDRWYSQISLIHPAIGGLAGELGLLTRRFMDFVTSGESLTKIKKILGDTRTLVGALSLAMAPLLAGFLDLGTVGTGWLASFAPSLQGVLTTWGKWMSEVAASGQAMAWMDGALAVLKQLWGIGGDLIGIFQGIFGAANSAGTGVLGIFGQLVSAANEWVNSTRGQEVLVTIFQSLHQIGQALAPVFTTFAGVIGQLAPHIANVAVALGPGLAAAVSAIGNALNAMGPGLVVVASGLSQAFANPALAAGLLALGSAIGDILVSVTPLLPLIAELAGTFLSALAPALPPLITGLVSLVQVLGEQLIRVLTDMAPYIPDLAKAVSDLAIALVPVIPLIADLLIAAMPLIPVVTDLIRLFAMVATTAMPELSRQVKTAADGLRVISEVARTVTRWVVDAFQWLYDTMVGHSIVPDLVNGIIRWIAFLPGKFGEYFGLARQWAVDRMNGLATWLRGLPNMILSAVGNLGGLLGGVGRDMIIGLWNGMVGMYNWLRTSIINFFSSIMPQWVKNALGIGSPSRLMADEVGREIPAGVAVGVTENSDVVRSATQSMVDQAMVGASAGSAAGFGGLSGGAAQGMGGLHIGNLNFSGWVDLRDPSAAARRFLQELREQLRLLETEYA